MFRYMNTIVFSCIQYSVQRSHGLYHSVCVSTSRCLHMDEVTEDTFLGRYLWFRDEILHNIRQLGPDSSAWDEGPEESSSICQASLSPALTPLVTCEPTMFRSLQEPFTFLQFALWKSPCFLQKDFFYPFERMHCTLYTRLDSVEFYYFICNHICIYFPQFSEGKVHQLCIYEHSHTYKTPRKDATHSMQ